MEWAGEGDLDGVLDCGEGDLIVLEILYNLLKGALSEGSESSPPPSPSTASSLPSSPSSSLVVATGSPPTCSSALVLTPTCS